MINDIQFIVLPVKTNDKNKVEYTCQELKEILTEYYQKGYKEGYRKAIALNPSINWIGTNPNTIPLNSDWKITCTDSSAKVNPDCMSTKITSVSGDPFE